MSENLGAFTELCDSSMVAGQPFSSEGNARGSVSGEAVGRRSFRSSSVLSRGTGGFSCCCRKSKRGLSNPRRVTRALQKQIRNGVLDGSRLRRIEGNRPGFSVAGKGLLGEVAESGVSKDRSPAGTLAFGPAIPGPLRPTKATWSGPGNLKGSVSQAVPTY